MGVNKESFLAQVATYICETYCNPDKSLKQIAIVFPTQRSIKIFQSAFLEAMQTRQPMFAPNCFSIEDFFQKLSNKQQAEADLQLITLYKLSHDDDTTELLADFAGKGQTILSDFAEIDKELADVKNLFKNLYDIKAIEQFDPEIAKAFENQVANSDKFLKFFEKLPFYYEKLNDLLAEKGFCTQGQIYRHVATHQEEIIKDLPYEKVIFVGFYALSNAEKTFIQALQKKNLLDYIIDADQFYFNNNHEIYSSFDELKKIGIHFNENFLTDNYARQNKQIFIHQVPLVVLQAKILPQLIEKYQNEALAIVPADESLLVSVLDNVDTLGKWNVTMRFPIKKTYEYQLVDTIFNILLLSQGESIRYKYLYPLLVNPIISLINDKIVDWRNINHAFCTKNNFIEILTTNIGDDDNRKKIFELLAELLYNSSSSIDFLSNIDLFLKTLNNYIKTTRKYENGNIFSIIDVFANLRELTKEMNSIDMDSIRYLFDTDIAGYNLSIKTTARNQKDEVDVLWNHQLMGLLETRTLDFKNIVMLSVNEGVLPKKPVYDTFLPYDLRRFFKMPTFENNDKMYAYHFYRLLQRAENIHLLYLQTDAQSEKSRFIMQLEEELKDRENIKFFYQDIAFGDVQINNDDRELAIAKTGMVERNKKVDGESKREQVAIMDLLKDISYSQSSILEYLKCSMQFYLHKILDLSSKDINEDMDNALLGTIIHAYLEQQAKTDQFISIVNKSENRKALEEEVKKELLALAKNPKITEVVYQDADLIRGKNYLMIELAVKYICNYIHFLARQVKANPTYLSRISAAEQKIELKNNEFLLDDSTSIKLKGIIDRVDKVGESTYILDYKTGNCKEDSTCYNPKKEGEESELINKNKEKVFQLLFYAYLYYKANSRLADKSAIIALRYYRQMEFFLKQKNDKSSEDIIIDEALMEKFETELKRIFQEHILNPEENFTCTSDTQACKYCNYQLICGVSVKNNF